MAKKKVSKKKVKKAPKKKAPKKASKKKKKVSKKKPVKKAIAKKASTPRTLINFKVTSSESKAVHLAAKRYMKGNLSAWVRFASTKFRPSNAQISSTRKAA